MSETTKVADGVWRVAGDFRNAMNVFLIEDEGGVTMFDAATKGMVKPIRLAVLRLTTSSNFVACCTGKSPGLAPLRILST